VDDLATGTDGELITWDASGNPTTVATGTSGHVLTSNGAGAAPTFQAAAGGGATLVVNGTSDTNATASLENIDELSFTATLNTNYMVEFHLYSEISGGGADAAVAVDIPSGTIIGAAVGADGEDHVEADATATVGLTNNAEDLIHGSVYIEVGGTGGTIIFQHAELNAAQTHTIREGSWIRYEVVP
jgi:hypothetical protein